MNTHLLVTVEGQDGIGKSTVIEELKKLLSTSPQYPCSFTRDPGGTESCELIRNIVKGNYNLDDYTDLLLYTASRHELVMKKIIPEILSGNIVIIDRFILSTIVYQQNLKRILALAKPTEEQFINTDIEIYNYVLVANTGVVEARKKTKTGDLDEKDYLNTNDMREKYIRSTYAVSRLNNIFFENTRIVDANISAEVTAKEIYNDLVSIIEGK